MEMVRGFSFAVASSRENDVVEDILEVALNEASMVISDDFVMVMEEGERCVCVCARVCVCLFICFRTDDNQITKLHQKYLRIYFYGNRYT